MKYFAIVAIASVVVYGIHRLALSAAERGWIYYGEHRRKPGGNFNFLAPIYQPSMEHVIEEEQRVRVTAEEEEAGEGDPDHPGD